MRTVALLLLCVILAGCAEVQPALDLTGAILDIAAPDPKPVQPPAPFDYNDPVQRQKLEDNARKFDEAFPKLRGADLSHIRQIE